jgi:hypothetical protein
MPASIRQGYNTVKQIYTTKKSLDWPGLSIRLSGSSGNASELPNLSKLERGRVVS